MQADGESIELNEPLLPQEKPHKKNMSPLMRKITYIVNENFDENMRKTTKSQSAIKKFDDVTEKFDFKLLMKMFTKISQMSGVFILASISFFLIRTINVIFLGHFSYNESNITNINVTQIGNFYLNCFGYIFCIGTMHAFESLGARAFSRKDFNLLYDIFQSAKIFTFLFFVLLVLPFCFCSKYILILLKFEPEFLLICSNYIRILLISTTLNLLHLINGKLLQLLGYETLVMGIYLITLVVHVLSCLFLIATFGLGVYGAAISSVISSFFAFVSTSYFIYIYAPFQNKSILNIDTDVLSTSKFYIYAKFGASSGLLTFLNEVRFEIIIILTYYLNDANSLAANSILYNYISLLYHLVVGFSYPVNVCIKYYLVSKKPNKALVFVQTTIFIVILIASIVSLVNYFFNSWIAFIYVNDTEVAEKFRKVIMIFCFMIFVNWINIIFNFVLIGMNHDKVVNILSSLFYLIIFVPFGIFLAFVLGYGYIGFWYATFIHMLIFLVIEVSYILYLDVGKNLKNIINDINNVVEDEDIFFK
jgi:Na+-driven multidrug efflux pump